MGNAARLEAQWYRLNHLYKNTLPCQSIKGARCLTARERWSPKAKDEPVTFGSTSYRRSR